MPQRVMNNDSKQKGGDNLARTHDDPTVAPVVDSFDVVVEQVIGTISYGTVKPHVAAFVLIAEHDSEGVYSFPMHDGRTSRVTVEFLD